MTPAQLILSRKLLGALFLLPGPFFSPPATGTRSRSRDAGTALFLVEGLKLLGTTTGGGKKHRQKKRRFSAKGVARTSKSNKKSLTASLLRTNVETNGPPAALHIKINKENEIATTTSSQSTFVEAAASSTLSSRRSHDANDPALCANHPECAKLALAGACCPNGTGDHLSCCSTEVVDQTSWPAPEVTVTTTEQPGGVDVVTEQPDVDAVQDGGAEQQETASTETSTTTPVCVPKAGLPLGVSSTSLVPVPLPEEDEVHAGSTWSCAGCEGGPVEEEEEMVEVPGIDSEGNPCVAVVPKSNVEENAPAELVSTDSSPADPGTRSPFVPLLPAGSLLSPISSANPVDGVFQPLRHTHPMRVYEGFAQHKVGGVYQTNRFWANWAFKGMRYGPYGDKDEDLSRMMEEYGFFRSVPIYVGTFALFWVDGSLAVLCEPHKITSSEQHQLNMGEKKMNGFPSAGKETFSADGEKWMSETGNKAKFANQPHAFAYTRPVALNEISLSIDAVELLSAQEKRQYEIVKESLLGIHATSTATATGSKILYPIYNGMSYVSAYYEPNLTPVLLFNAITPTKITVRDLVGQPPNVFAWDFEMDAVQGGSVWRVFLLPVGTAPVTDLAWDHDANLRTPNNRLRMVQLNQQFQGWLRVAQVQSSARKYDDGVQRPTLRCRATKDEWTATRTTCASAYDASAAAVLYDMGVDLQASGLLNYEFKHPPAALQPLAASTSGGSGSVAPEHLHFAYQTHLRHLKSNPDNENDFAAMVQDLQFQSMSQGWMTAVRGSRWSMKPNLLGEAQGLDFMPKGDSSGTLNLVSGQVLEDLRTEFRADFGHFKWGAPAYSAHNSVPAPGGVYNGGKKFQKFAVYCLLAEELFGAGQPVADAAQQAQEDEENMELCPKILKELFLCWINPAQDFCAHVSGQQIPLAYEPKFGGVINPTMSPAAEAKGDAINEETPGIGTYCDPDFGNICFNDQHYHYGYFVYSAAVLMKFKGEEILQEGAVGGNRLVDVVHGLLRAVANPAQNYETIDLGGNSMSDPYFPMFRYFDLFDLHSWSRGLRSNTFGKDQESTSEEINFYHGAQLWGRWMKVHGKKLQLPEYEQLGARLETIFTMITALNAQSIRTFYQMEEYENFGDIHPLEFARNHCVGMLYQNEVKYSTWFGPAKEFMHGIQMMPLTTALRLARDPEFMKLEYYDAFDCKDPANYATDDWSCVAPCTPVDISIVDNHVTRLGAIHASLKMWIGQIATGNMALTNDANAQKRAYDILQAWEQPARPVDAGSTLLYYKFWVLKMAEASGNDVTSAGSLAPELSLSPEVHEHDPASGELLSDGAPSTSSSSQNVEPGDGLSPLSQDEPVGGLYRNAAHNSSIFSSNSSN
ncbi:unnamed protein product [Amoebophrya sp. A120]|nr:unnamed protein product [Amoebophrya sp. A120]|eukprot:GSA120T00020460001.1